MGYKSYQIEIRDIYNNNNPYMVYWFYLDINNIEKELKKLKIEEDSQKYNL